MSFQALNWVKSMQLGDSSARFVAYMLANYADEEGTCFPTIAMLAGDTDLSERTVRDAIKRLEDKALVTKVRQRNQDGTLGRNRYKLALEGKPKLHAENGSKEAGPPADIAAGDEQSSPAEPDAHPAATDAHPAATAAGPIKDKPSSEPPLEPSSVEREGAQAREPVARERSSLATERTGETSTQTETQIPPPAPPKTIPFSKFWPKWPDRVASSKPQAQRVWDTITDSDRQAAIDGITPFHEVLKRKKRGAIPAASTYLAERKWEDLDGEAVSGAAYLPPEIKPYSPLWTAALIEHAKAPEGQRAAITLLRFAQRGQGGYLRFGKARDDELVAMAERFGRAQVDSPKGRAFVAWLCARLEGHQLWNPETLRLPDDFWLFVPPDDLAKAWEITPVGLRPLAPPSPQDIAENL
ncbi:MAG: helix-turn-helix domain-containing protein [Pseudomonadota bacterium]